MRKDRRKGTSSREPYQRIDAAQQEVCDKEEEGVVVVVAYAVGQPDAVMVLRSIRRCGSVEPVYWELGKRADWGLDFDRGCTDQLDDVTLLSGVQPS
jgi:hypothetical protein